MTPDCPQCGALGPHERVTAAVDGSHVYLTCRSCDLAWRVYG